MIAFSSVSKQYGGQILFVDASFQINPGEKVGLVGPNGAGKTTVFRLIAGEEQPDDGAIERPRKLSLGYFRQSVGELAGRSILAETCAGAGEVAELGAELARLSTRLEAAGDDLDDVVARFGEVQARYQDLGGYELEARAQAILAGLGFPEDTVGRDVGTLSGGWKMRVALAQILLARPDVLLLDEPTNYLDLESILWLEAFLRDFPGTVVMTCHDREIMNRVVGKIVEIDGGALRSYTGNYDFYEKMRVEEAQRREAEYARQQARLAKESRFIERFKTHVAKAAQVQSRIKKLDKLEKIAEPRRIVERTFEFRAPTRSGDDVVKIAGLRKAYGARVIHAGLDLTVRRKERWAVMGENGAGKSTLLKMMAGALAPLRHRRRLGRAQQLVQHEVRHALRDPGLDEQLAAREGSAQAPPPEQAAKQGAQAQGERRCHQQDVERRQQQVEAQGLAVQPQRAGEAKMPGGERRDAPPARREVGRHRAVVRFGHRVRGDHGPAAPSNAGAARASSRNSASRSAGRPRRPRARCSTISATGRSGIPWPRSSRRNPGAAVPALPTPIARPAATAASTAPRLALS